MSQVRWRDEDGVTLLQKGKSGFFQVVFGRSALILLMLLAQIGILILFFNYLSSYSSYFVGILLLLDIYLVIAIFNADDNPTIKLSWVVLMIASPAVGALLYLFVSKEAGHRTVRAAQRRIEIDTQKFEYRNDALMRQLETKDKPLHNLSEYLENHGGFSVYEHTRVKYFPMGQDKFEELLIQLEKAQSFIFMEYFIVKEGYMWGRILNILERKVKEGVEVRVMYDGMCSIMMLPYSYPEELSKLGIKSKMFSPIKPFISTHYNNRDHRKIVVIDGKVAFTGGVNLADEYIGITKPFGVWKDTAIMVEGEAVKSFTLMFLRMWNTDNMFKRHKKGTTPAQMDQYARYLDNLHEEFEDAKGYVIPYGDTPFDHERVGEMVYLDIINQAKDYVHIMTPYLILDNETIVALTYAAKRGVDVKIILPHIPDKKYAFALAKTHYKELTKAGVHIYEYTPGFVHAKVFVSDDIRAVVGTINLDYRSLYLHFECAAYLHGVEQIEDIEADFRSTLNECFEVTETEIKNEKLSMRFMGSVLKLIAPLM